MGRQKSEQGRPKYGQGRLKMSGYPRLKTGQLNVLDEQIYLQALVGTAWMVVDHRSSHDGLVVAERKW